MDLMTFLFGDGSCVMAWQAIPAIMAVVQTGVQIAQQQKQAKLAEEASDDAKEAAAKGGGGQMIGAQGVPASMIPAGDYRANENAFWQQAFAGTGQGLPGGQLPESLQEGIDRQAALLG